MKSLLMASVAVAALVAATSSTFAAGPFNWAGAYVGASVGGVRLNNDETIPYGSGMWSGDVSGLMGVVDAGYNWQHGGVVYGVEADLGASNASRADSLHMGMGWTGSLLGKLGLAQDNYLFYLDAGLTAAHLTDYASGDVDGMHDGTRIGGTIGVGTELAVSDKLSLKGEVRYTVFQNETLFNGDYVSKENSTIGLVGLNYHF